MRALTAQSGLAPSIQLEDLPPGDDRLTRLIARRSSAGKSPSSGAMATSGPCSITRKSRDSENRNELSPKIGGQS